MFRREMSLPRAALLIFLVFQEISGYDPGNYNGRFYPRREIKGRKLTGGRSLETLLDESLVSMGKRAVSLNQGPEPNKTAPGSYNGPVNMGKRRISRKLISLKDVK
ncbi:uncharacterized protein LOC110066267 isoform X2 [Orbicella faveolata]|uniref:uncharacterized protein LOC110066267 isoform X2 n=1 Tax=Orbicella faveolata TaxID=48498 RepID=UPI0009E27694|nr:uncharacterized protein LOC110066267 isoform X2 [Orbicella faveolata]